MAYTAGTIGTNVVIQNPTMTQGSDATGDVYYRDANGKLARLAPAASGTVLTSAGAGVIPSFAAVAAGADPNLVQSHAYLITGPVTVPNGSGSMSDLITMAFTKEENAATSKLIFNGAARVFNSVGASSSWKGKLYDYVSGRSPNEYVPAPVTTSHGAPPAGVQMDIYRLNDGQSSPYRTGHFVTLGPFETDDYANGAWSFRIRHYRDGYDALKVDWINIQITEVLI